MSKNYEVESSDLDSVEDFAETSVETFPAQAHKLRNFTEP
jgi:hypothetical protein